MSWSKRIYSNIYKRYFDKFSYRNWLHQEIEDDSHWDDWLWNQEMKYYDDWGAPKSLEQLHQYRLLTLLGRFKIKSAIKTIDQIGWY